MLKQVAKIGETFSDAAKPIKPSPWQDTSARPKPMPASSMKIRRR
jgi:hypothetical protein